MTSFFLKYRDKLAGLPLKKKILCLFLPLVTIPLIFLAVISSQIISDAGIRKAEANSMDKLTLISRQFTSLIDDVGYGVKIFSVNSQLQDLMKKPYYQGALAELNYTAKLNLSFTSLLNVSGFVKNAQIIMANGIVYDPYRNRITNEPSLTDSEIYRHSLDNIGQIVIHDPHAPVSLEDKNPNSALLISKAVIDVKTGTYLGVVTITIGENTVASVYHGIQNGRSGEYFIVNRQGYIVSALDKDKLYTSVRNHPYFPWLLSQKEKGRIFKMNWHQYLVTSIPLNNPLENSEWYLVSIVPLSELIEENYKVTAGIIFIALVLTSLTIFISYWLARSITTPLARLVNVTNQISSGNLDIELRVNSRDEIGRLAVHFNTMVSDIRQLMVKNYLEQKKKREYELSLLQSQVNPHFLYNTIENVRSLILEGQSAPAEAMLANLGHFYKRVLSIGRDLITIREEIELTVSYMRIEQYRHSEIFDFTIDVPEPVLQSKILKLTLQPLVENAINHGFRGYCQHGLIRIGGRIAADLVILEVSDNGKGIPPEIIAPLFAASAQPAPRKNFGLKNIDERIKLQFGGVFGITVLSKPETGTTITIRLPRLSEGVALC